MDVLLAALMELLHSGNSIVATKPAVEATETRREVELKTPDQVRAYARKVSRQRYSYTQWNCLDKLIYRESRWNHKAKNGSHYGLGQVRNMKVGTPVQRQLQRIYKYINHRYDSPCAALRHSYRYGWY